MSGGRLMEVHDVARACADEGYSLSEVLAAAEEGYEYGEQTALEQKELP